MDNLYFNPKRLRQIANKRSCRSFRIWGWILTALGGVAVLDGFTALLNGGHISNVIDGLIFLLPGLFLLWYAKKQVGKWDRYEALIDNKGNTSIKMLSEKMKLPEKTVIADIYKMIGNDFFIGPNYNIESYIDGERDMLVMAVGGKPLKPLPPIAQQSKPEEASQQTETAAQQSEGQAKQDTAIRVELTDLEMIQKVIAETSDDEARNSLYGIEGSLRRIDRRVQSDPELKKKSSIRKLYKYYLPQIMDLIREYREKNTPPELRSQIREALHTSAGALANIEAGILEKEQMDLEVDIQVLKNMFAQDGLLKQDLDTGAKATKARERETADTQVAMQQEQRVQTNASQ